MLLFKLGNLGRASGIRFASLWSRPSAYCILELEQVDDAWLTQIQEECGRGTVERCGVWEKQKEMKLRGNESVSS